MINFFRNNYLYFVAAFIIGIIVMMTFIYVAYKGATVTNYGEVNYKAYLSDRKGLTFDGRLAPTWDELPPNIKTAWDTGAKAAIEEFKKNLTLDDLNWMLKNWTLNE